MPANDYRFTISVSEQCYYNKPNKKEKWWKDIRFFPHEVSVAELLQLAKEGRVFCGSFKTENADGSFGCTEKNEKDYISTSTIFFDIDGSEYPMEKYIDNLPYKPSFAFTTFSNGIEGNRFRLGYIFSRSINGKEAFDRMYHAIAIANGFTLKTKEHGGLDVRGCHQCYFGTTPFAETYISEYVYSHYDFDEFVSDYSPSSGVCRTILTTTESTDIDKTFLNDFYHLPFSEFFEKYKDEYYRTYRLSVKPLLIIDKSEMYYSYPHPYYEVLYKRRGGKQFKWNIGDDRKKRIFVTAQIMLTNNPSMTIEREWHYINHDNKISNDVLVEKAKYCIKYRYPLFETEHPLFKVNKTYWKEQGMNVMQAVNRICYTLRLNEIKKVFNPSLSIKDNCQLLYDSGIKISERTLKRMVTRGDIRIIETETHNTILSQCRSDVTNPVTKEILKLITYNNHITQSQVADTLQVDIRTIKRYFDEMKGVLIERVGNNRTGYWKVLSQE